MQPGAHARFLWFWTFWHWSRESWADGELLRQPLHAIASHWDEWYHHEASPQERQQIDAIGGVESDQLSFVTWLFERWAQEVESRENPLVPVFVAGQLARVAPFKQWPGFRRYLHGYDLGGLSAVVLAKEHVGEAEDVRSIEAVVLPTEDSTGQIAAEGFQAEHAELSGPHEAALSVTSATGRIAFLALWLLFGARPYPRWLNVLLGVGWLAAGGLIVFLLFGPEPHESLVPLAASLLVGWSMLAMTAMIFDGILLFRAWTAFRQLNDLLRTHVVRLRMNGGLILRGRSAGLAFFFNILLAAHRARPGVARRSWIMRTLLEKLGADAPSWAATGVVTRSGWIRPVVLSPKFGACLKHPRIVHFLTPYQRARKEEFSGFGATVAKAQRPTPSPEGMAFRGVEGFAAERSTLRRHCSVHVAQAMMTVGGLFSRRRSLMTALGLAISVTMIAGLPDLCSIVMPPKAPAVVSPASPSPYSLWVSLDTSHPRAFQVVLESHFWVSRRADVRREQAEPASTRAEIKLQKASRPLVSDPLEGTVWIERRRAFLTRDYEPGEPVGRYSLSYVIRPDHE